MKKVVIFTSSLNPGGIERSILRFLRYAGDIADYTIVVRNGRTGELYDDYKALGVNIVYQSVGYFNLHKWIKIYRFLIKNKFDIVCDYTANFSGITLWLSKIAGIKSRVAFYRSSTNHYGKSRIKDLYNNWLNNLVYNNATKILANSKAALHFFFKSRNIDIPLFDVLYNGIEANEFSKEYNTVEIKNELNLPINSVVVGHTGRYSWPKNFPLLVSIAENITEKYENVYFVFCGRNTDDKFIEDYPDVTRNPKIKILGYQADVPKILSIYDIFVFPSTTEGQPNSLIEALFSGLPIVASNIEPIKECVPESMVSELIDPHCKEEFIKRVSYLIENENVRKESDFSGWAKDRYDSKILFDKFIFYLGI